MKRDRGKARNIRGWKKLCPVPQSLFALSLSIVGPNGPAIT